VTRSPCSRTQGHVISAQIAATTTTSATTYVATVVA
jgi:hypothetical protein